ATAAGPPPVARLGIGTALRPGTCLHCLEIPRRAARPGPRRLGRIACLAGGLRQNRSVQCSRRIRPEILRLDAERHPPTFRRSGPPNPESLGWLPALPE